MKKRRRPMILSLQKKSPTEASKTKHLDTLKLARWSKKVTTCHQSLLTKKVVKAAKQSFQKEIIASHFLMESSELSSKPILIRFKLTKDKNWKPKTGNRGLVKIHLQFYPVSSLFKASRFGMKPLEKWRFLSRWAIKN